MKNVFQIFLLLVLLSCRSQTENRQSASLVGGPCEGCEAIFEYEGRTLSPVDTLPGYTENTPKLKITGKVFEADGKTPAKDVILYIYHTNRDGIYETRGDETGWARRHGFIRGWIKTGKDGNYTFYTFRPGSYPIRNVQEHIHITVKEPGKNEYYIDDFVFEDDPLLTKTARERVRNRGGTGVVRLIKSGELFLVQRDIVLGLNIPNYD